jgi:hypothetical protein
MVRIVPKKIKQILAIFSRPDRPIDSLLKTGNTSFDEYHRAAAIEPG